jgi:hypothetical protein
MRRREFIAGLGGAAVWPRVARAQQGERMRRIGVLNAGDENDPAAKSYVAAFTRALADLGWSDGRNVRMDVQWGGGDANRIRGLAQELVGLHATRHHPDRLDPNDRCPPAGDADDPDRHRGRGRSRPQRLRRAAQPAGREHHRLRHLPSLAGKKVSKNIQRGTGM